MPAQLDTCSAARHQPPAATADNNDINITAVLYNLQGARGMPSNQFHRVEWVAVKCPVLYKGVNDRLELRELSL
jgi:hypothetical protein